MASPKRTGVTTHQNPHTGLATDLALGLWVRPGPAGAAQELLTASACGSWPVTCRQPALGTNLDDDPESQHTVISRPSTSVTTPLRVADPTFSDSTSTRSPTSAMSTSSAIDATSRIKSPQAANRPQEGCGWQLAGDEAASPCHSTCHSTRHHSAPRERT